MRDRQRLLAAPLVVYVVAFVGWPAVRALELAFTDGTTGAFPSLASFRVLADDALFWRAVAGNVVLPVLTVALELASGLALALLLATRLPARRLLRLAVVVPFALPEIVFLTVVRYLLAPRGYANAALAAAGLGPVDWLAPGRTATWLTVVAVDAWHTTPIVFLMLLAALAAIPPEIDEAARLDGAGGVRRLVHVTLPLLAPAIVAAVFLRGLDALRVFATPLVLTGVEGVPVLSTYAYHQWSDYGDDGAAAAAASLLALLSVVLTVPLLRWRLRPAGAR
ncbi:MAG TPA: sugar ABC transporter permease [Candidatus Binatia bacterium]|nr:sugar ABC transporter permease [Candidatus Binatia bacterium]